MNLRVKLIDIALELGYSDPANFTRAFKRWTEGSPHGIRRGQTTAPDSEPLIGRVRPRIVNHEQEAPNMVGADCTRSKTETQKCKMKSSTGGWCESTLTLWNDTVTRMAHPGGCSHAGNKFPLAAR